MTNFPSTDGRRLTVSLNSGAHAVALMVRGPHRTGPVLFQLPAFIDNMASTTSGSIDQATGTVRLPAPTKSVTVHYRHSPA